MTTIIIFLLIVLAACGVKCDLLLRGKMASTSSNVVDEAEVSP
jgi:predicted small lipoprotein YifL